MPDDPREEVAGRLGALLHEEPAGGRAGRAEEVPGSRTAPRRRPFRDAGPRSEDPLLCVGLPEPVAVLAVGDARRTIDSLSPNVFIRFLFADATHVRRNVGHTLDRAVEGG